MATLKQVLAGAGMSQRELGELVGVSTQLIYLWAAGRRPMPPGRAVQVEDALGLERGTLSEMQSANPRPVRLLKEEPTTLFAFLVAFVVPGEDYREKVENAAEAMDVSVYEIDAYMKGHRMMSIQQAKSFGLYLRNVNPVVFKYEVEAPADPRAEADAVYLSLSKIRKARLSFEDAVRRLDADRIAFEDKPPPDYESVMAELDNGQEVPDHLWEKAERFHAGL